VDPLASVEARMRALPLLLCSTTSGEALELDLERWRARRADHQAREKAFSGRLGSGGVSQEEILETQQAAKAYALRRERSKKVLHDGHQQRRKSHRSRFGYDELQVRLEELAGSLDRPLQGRERAEKKKKASIMEAAEKVPAKPATGWAAAQRGGKGNAMQRAASLRDKGAAAAKGALNDWLTKNEYRTGDEGVEEEIERRTAMIGEEPSALMRRVMHKNPAGYEVNTAKHEAMMLLESARKAEDRFLTLEKHPSCAVREERLMKSLTGVRASRPYFCAPGEGSRVKKTRANVVPSETPVVVVEKAPWNIDHSIFGPRRFESDAKDYYDNDKVNARRLNLDWSRVTAKERFLKLIASADAGAKADMNELKQELEEIKEAMLRNYNTICRGFSYFCLTGQGVGEVCYSMSLNQYSAFLQDAEIPDKKSKACKMSDLDTIFITTNFEEEKKGELAEANDDLALMRFEFLEIIVRIAIAKFGRGVETDDVSDAVDILCQRCVDPNLCPEAVIDNNEFRRDRLYREEIAEIFESHEKLLRACYAFYRSEYRAKLLPQEGFVQFCQQAGLISLATGMSPREAKLIFGQSQMVVVDEVKKRERVYSMTFVDFLDALGRCAELISPPTVEDLTEGDEPFFHETNEPTTETLVWEYYNTVPKDKADDLMRDSCDMTVAKTRPLLLKLELMFELMITTLLERFGCESEAKLTKDLNTLAKRRAG